MGHFQPIAVRPGNVRFLRKQSFSTVRGDGGNSPYAVTLMAWKGEHGGRGRFQSIKTGTLCRVLRRYP